ncbi:MAG TPA: hypothetical protein VKY73_12400 [Polyangiaceae bacterium]|nr:hypothetical protein [Polyangiaceae bacterium]
MNTEERVARLEALLERVQRNAAYLRAERGVVPTYDPYGDEAEPVPLVRVTSAPPGRLLERLSERPPQGPAEPVSSVTASVDFDDGEIVDVPADALESLPPSMPPPEADESALLAEHAEEPPDSSQRPRVASTMDEALAAAAESEAEDGREVPIVTPPPESGPQEAPLPSGLAAPSTPDVEVFFESEPPSAIAVEPQVGSSPGQPGERFDSGEPSSGPAIELEPPAPSAPTASGPAFELAPPSEPAASGPVFELAPPAPSQPEPSQPVASEPALELEPSQPSEAPPVAADLEAALSAAAAEERTLAPPPAPEASVELEALDRGFAPSAPPPPVESGEVARGYESAEPGTVARERASEGPEVYRPSLPTGVAVAQVRAPEPAPRPATFLELLDASLALGTDE